MKYSKIFRILVLAIILSLMMMAIPATPALAQYERIFLSPSRGGIGDNIGVYGYYFDVGSRVYIYFSSYEAEEGDYIDDLDAYEEVERVYSVVGTGYMGVFDTDFEVPDELTDGDDLEEVYGGDYYVYATYTREGRITAIAEFSVIGIKLNPEEGNVGDEIEISGAGFTSNRDITIKYAGEAVDIASGDEETDDDGEFTCSIVIPESTAGSHTISVKAYYEAEARFSVEPEITISPTSGSIGDIVSVSGTGFGKRKDVTIYFARKEVWTIKADSKGGFSGVTFTVPESYWGSHAVEAEDTSYNSAGAAFTTKHSSITVIPISGVVGDEVTVSGTGFRAGKLITITFNNVTVGTATTNTSGSFSGSFLVPSHASGTCKVRVSDGVSTSDADFAILISASLVPVTSLDSPGHVGMELTISGTGFIANHQVTIIYLSEPVTVATTTTDAKGAFSATFSTPASAGGAHTITATDGINTISKTFYMESISPPVPVPLLPLLGSKAKPQAYFDWEDVTDPSGVTYTLEIARDENFTNIVLKKEGLTASEYTITKGESLPSVTKEAPYYWHVKAIDRAFNETVWTGTGTFYVTHLSLTPVTSLDLPGYVGMELTVSGTGFIANHQVTITYDADAVTTSPASVTTDTDGAFSATFSALASTGGAHTITTTDGTNTISKTFYMESTPPAPPAPLLPLMGSKAESKTYFDWEDITDPSGVTYILEIAKDENFTNIVLKKEGLTGSEYTITKEESLPSVTKEAPYYWRVKAVDGASNESKWSGTGSFYVGFIFAMPKWAIYTLLGILALLITVLGFWLGRRTAYSSYSSF